MPTIELVAAVVLALIAAIACGHVLARLGFPAPVGTRIGHVDGLRGYLGLAVMCHHFIIWTSVKAGGKWEEPSGAFVQLGKGSVGLFFMITGLVFYPRVLSGIRQGWAAIYVKRIFRIVPLLLFSILAVTTIIAINTGLRPDLHYPLEVVSWLVGKMTFDIMGFDQSKRINAGVLWSIYYEWVFYFLLLPACAIAREFVGRKTWLVPLALLMAGILGRLTDMSIFTYIPLFAAGMLTYELKMLPEVVSIMQTRSMSIAAFAALFIAIIAFRTPYGLALPLFGFFFLAVVCGNSLFGLFGGAGNLVLGECSYGTYLLHGIVLYIAFTTLDPERMPLLALPVISVIVTLLTAFTYRVIEAPGIEAGRRIARLMPSTRRHVAEATVAP